MSEQTALLATLERVLDARRALYSALSAGRAHDLGSYLADRDRRAEDEESLTEPVLQAIIEQLLGFPPDGYVAQLTRDHLKPDFTPIDLVAHRFVLDAKSTLQTLDRHESQIRRYMDQRRLDFGVLFNLRELRVYRRGAHGHDVDLSFSVIALWEHAKGRTLPGPEVDRLEGFARLFRFRRQTTAEKIRQIIRAPAWRDVERREAVTVDVDYLVVRLRELSRVLAEDAAVHAADLDRRLALRPARAQALVEELRGLALELQPSAIVSRLPDTVAGFREHDGLPRRAWQQYLVRVAQLALIRVLLFRSWEDAGFVDEHLYDGGFERVYGRMGHDVGRVLQEAFNAGRARYRWLYAEDNNYDWYRPTPDVLVDVLYALLPVPLGKLDADVLGGLYESYVDDIDRDRLGQFYTPRSVVRFMLDRAKFRGPAGVFRLEGDARRPVRLLDFSTGSGGFLVEAARRIVHEALQTDTVDALRDALRAIVVGFSGSEVSPFPYFLTEVNLLLQVSRLLGRMRELGEPLDDFVLGVVPADTLAARSGAIPDPEGHGTGAYALIPADVEKRNAFERIRDEQFDLVIGNPPYVAEAGNKVLFQRLRKLPQWKGAVKGKTDYLYYFLLLAAEKLKPGGRLCVITSASWFNAGEADDLRARLADDLRLDELFLFGAFQLFRPELDHRQAERAVAPPTVESAILVATKSPAPEDHRVRVVELRDVRQVAKALELRDANRLQARDLLQQMSERTSDARARVRHGIATRWMRQSECGDGELPWPVKFGENELPMRIVRHLERALGSLRRPVERLDQRWQIEQGIQTGADAYTKRIDKRLTDEQRADLERHDCRIGDPVLELPPGAENRPPWSSYPGLLARAPESRGILYGAIDANDYVSLVWIDRRDAVPRAVEETLERWKPLLASRAEIARNERRRWFETAWPRDKEQLSKPKVIALYRTDRGRFALDEDGSWQPSIKTTVCTAKEDGLSVAYLCGLLNSELLDLYYAVRGKIPRDVWRNYEPKPMGRLPYRHVEGLDEVPPPPALERALADRDIRAATSAAAAIADPAGQARGLELVVRALAANRTALLGHRAVAPLLRAQVKDPWRDAPVAVDAGALVATMSPTATRSVRIDPELRVTGANTGRLGRASFDAGELTFRHRRRVTATVGGAPNRVALLAEIVGSRQMDAADLLSALLPTDLGAFRLIGTERDAEIRCLVAEGRALVEIAERLVGRLYAVPDALVEAVVRHAAARAARGLVVEPDTDEPVAD
jgi:hypothetical protein